MSPEFYHAIYTALAFALGWTCHIGWKMLVRWHDADKDRKISLYEREIFRLRAQLDVCGGEMAEAAPAPMPLEDTPPSRVDANPQPAPRKRRSPVKAQITPIQPFKFDTAKVPQGIGQADLGRMQAQLSAFGQCRAVRTGSEWHGRN